MFGMPNKPKSNDQIGQLILAGIGIAIGIALWPLVLPLLIIALIISAIRQPAENKKRQD